MLYIHSMSCISPQKTFTEKSLDELMPSDRNMLHAIEPAYEGIPPGQLRRMGKAVRLGVGAALPLLKAEKHLDGIIIGTANGGMEDCIRFLNQIFDYDEGTLTPTNFVNSTANAIASQVAFLSVNKGYNITHVHRGLSFENALLDAMMFSVEEKEKVFLIGGLDEISDYNFNIDYLLGCYKEEQVSNRDLYKINTSGTIAGEGVAMFTVSGTSDGSITEVKDMAMIQSVDEADVINSVKDFLERNNTNPKEVDLFLSGENGDERYAKYFNAIENVFPKEIPIARYKHATGEFPAASALSLWYACYFLQGNKIPEHMLKSRKLVKPIKKILIFNSYQGLQHSFILLNS